MAIRSAADLIGAAKRPVALVSSWGSNEELAAFHAALGPSFTSYVKADWVPQPGERVEDDVLIKPDKNPNRAAATALYPALPENVTKALSDDTDLVFVWGEGAPFADIPSSAKVVLLTSYVLPLMGAHCRTINVRYSLQLN